MSAFIYPFEPNTSPDRFSSCSKREYQNMGTCRGDFATIMASTALLYMQSGVIAEMGGGGSHGSPACLPGDVSLQHMSLDLVAES